MVYLPITLNVSCHKRKDVVAKYFLYRDTILQTVNGMKSIELLEREVDFQVLHCFDFQDNANAYLESDFFINDLMRAFEPLLDSAYSVDLYKVVERHHF